VGKQIHFMMDKDMGFKKEAIVSVDVPNTDTSVAHRRYVLSEMQRVAGVSMVSLGNDVPSSFGWWTTDMKLQKGNKEDQVEVELKSGDTNYLKLFHIPLLAGRNLLPADTIKEILINETYLHVIGFKQPADAINTTVSWDDKIVPIVGVVKDFHAHPLNYKIAPMAICMLAKRYNEMIVAFAGEKDDWKKSIAGMEQVYKKAYPEESFSYTFLDESIAQSYGGEQQISNLLKWTTGLTIFISCLGLLGLVVYTTNQRTKEIGVRKVLGASVSHIVSILSKDFIKLVTIAFIIATPLSWWAFHAWLDNFAFRTAISWWVFLLGGAGMILIALLTLSFQTIRAARANPVESLRSE
jgi:putative ABC transport system permease protein